MLQVAARQVNLITWSPRRRGGLGGYGVSNELAGLCVQPAGDLLGCRPCAKLLQVAGACQANLGGGRCGRGDEACAARSSHTAYLERRRPGGRCAYLHAAAFWRAERCTVPPHWWAATATVTDGGGQAGTRSTASRAHGGAAVAQRSPLCLRTTHVKATPVAIDGRGVVSVLALANFTPCVCSREWGRSHAGWRDRR